MLCIHAHSRGGEKFDTTSNLSIFCGNIVSIKQHRHCLMATFRAEKTKKLLHKTDIDKLNFEEIICS